MTKALFGIVRNVQNAEQLVSHLRSIGFPTTEIGILFIQKGQQTSKTQQRGEEESWRTSESRPQKQTGAAPSGTIGALPNPTTTNIPNFGTVTVAGNKQLATTLNAKKGGQDPVMSTLQTLNVTEQEATRLAERVKNNGILIVATATSDDELDRARSSFESNQATDIIQSREFAGMGGKKSSRS